MLWDVEEEGAEAGTIRMDWDVEGGVRFNAGGVPECSPCSWRFIACEDMRKMGC